MGRLEVDESRLGLSRRDRALRAQKTRLKFGLPTDVSRICVTVRLPPHLRHSGSGFLTCWTEVGECERFKVAFVKGATRDSAPHPNPRKLKDNHGDNESYGGGGCLGHLPPHLLCYALYCLLCKQTMQSGTEEQSLHRGEKKTDQNTTKKKPRKKRKGVGCESGT